MGFFKDADNINLNIYIATTSFSCPMSPIPLKIDRKNMSNEIGFLINITIKGIAAVQKDTTIINKIIKLNKIYSVRDDKFLPHNTLIEGIVRNNDNLILTDCDDINLPRGFAENFITSEKNYNWFWPVFCGLIKGIPYFGHFLHALIPRCREIK